MVCVTHFYLKVEDWIFGIFFGSFEPNDFLNKAFVATFCQRFENIGLRLIPNSGHTILLNQRVHLLWVKLNASFWHTLQWDQNWQNLATLAKKFKVFGHFCRVLDKFLTYLGQLLCYWASLNCCDWPNIDQIIYPFGRTDKPCRRLDETEMELAVMLSTCLGKGFEDNVCECAQGLGQRWRGFTFC